MSMNITTFAFICVLAASVECAPRADFATRELRARHLSMPIATVRPDQLVSSFSDARTGHPHEALDILSPRGTPVVAVEDGTVAKLFWSRFGGNTIYQFDPTQRYAYYYAHLDRYADGLRQGQSVQRGQTIGYVGSTGNADPNAPHLHFAIFVLTPEKEWWKGTAVDPYPILRWAVDAPRSGSAAPAPGFGPTSSPLAAADGAPERAGRLNFLTRFSTPQSPEWPH